MVYKRKCFYKCSYCDTTFMKLDRLTSHESKHTGERPYACDELNCNKTFTNKAHLKRHKNTSHKDPNEQISTSIQCTKCSQVLRNNFCYKKHLKNVHEKAFTCDVCSLQFRKKHLLQEHKLVHAEISPYKCETCDNIEFSSLQLYKRHLTRHKSYTCDCGKTFTRWSEILAHKRTICTLKKEHKCIICSKTFSSPTNLKQHSIKVHVTESQKETYKCNYPNCSRSYEYKKNLEYHINFYHKKDETGIKTFKCDRCETVLKSTKNLKQHIRVVHSNLPKKERHRKTRKDKGMRKKAMASKLSGFQAPVAENREILENNLLNTDFQQPQESCDGSNKKIVIKKGISSLVKEYKNSKDDKKCFVIQQSEIISESEITRVQDDKLILKCSNDLEQLITELRPNLVQVE